MIARKEPCPIERRFRWARTYRPVVLQSSSSWIFSAQASSLCGKARRLTYDRGRSGTVRLSQHAGLSGV